MEAGLQGTRSRSGAAGSRRTRSICRAGQRGAAGGERRAGRLRRRGARFEQTGAYRLLLSAMSENPSELQRFYAETVEPLAAYDEQYETDLMLTLQTFLEADGNVAGTASGCSPTATRLLPTGARARAVGTGCRLERWAREAQPRAEGDARARISSAAPRLGGGAEAARPARVGRRS